MPTPPKAKPLRIVETDQRTALQKLLDRLRELYAEQRVAGRAEDSFAFTLTHEDERTLSLSYRELPGDLQAAVLIQGARAVFLQLYGVRVEWDAAATGVRELDAPAR